MKTMSPDERLTRAKSAGVSTLQPMPDQAIDECLAIGGIGRGDIDVVALSRNLFDYQYFALSGMFALKQAMYALSGRRRLRFVDNMMHNEGKTDASAVFRSELFLAREGFSRARIHFYNHHLAHGLPAYFYSRFDEALIHTADGLGDRVAYSARVGRRSGFELLFGGDECLFEPRESNSLGLLYAAFTLALGFTPNRHEGKLVGLAAHGRPVAVERILRSFRVEDSGRIRADFCKFRKNRSPKRESKEEAIAICRDLSPSDAAASIQTAVEILMAQSITALQKRTGLRNLAAGGGLYANVRMNRHLFENTAEIGRASCRERV